MPLLLLFILPLLSSLFSGIGGGGPSGPAFDINGPVSPLTQQHVSSKLKIPYWVNPVEVDSYSKKSWQELDKRAEHRYVSAVSVQCDRERADRDRLIQDAQGFFWTDQSKLDEARAMEMKNCRRLGELGYRY